MPKNWESSENLHYVLLSWIGKIIYLIKVCVIRAVFHLPLPPPPRITDGSSTLQFVMWLSSRTLLEKKHPLLRISCSIFILLIHLTFKLFCHIEKRALSWISDSYSLTSTSASAACTSQAIDSNSLQRKRTAEKRTSSSFYLTISGPIFRWYEARVCK